MSGRPPTRWEEYEAKVSRRTAMAVVLLVAMALALGFAVGQEWMRMRVERQLQNVVILPAPAHAATPLAYEVRS